MIIPMCPTSHTNNLPSQPHCIRFRDTFAKVAKATQTKHPTVQFYGVSCIAMGSLCRKYEVQKYPTILAMPQGTDQKETVGQFMFSVQKLETALHL